jgi:hypothetical protein
LRAQLQRLEADLGEYKDINKQFTDQLMKVKVTFLTTSPQNDLI